MPASEQVIELVERGVRAVSREAIAACNSLARRDVHDRGHEAFGERGEIFAREAGAIDRLLLCGGLGDGRGGRLDVEERGGEESAADGCDPQHGDGKARQK